MKGVVFNLMEEVIVRQHGEDLWDELLDSAKVSGAYTSLGSYADDELFKLVTAASERLELSADVVLRWFGQQAMPVLASRYPSYFSAHTSTRQFLLSLNQVIHPEVRKIYPGADVPDFDFEDAVDGALLMSYRSSRKLCALAQGFTEGAAQHYGESLQFEHLQCMHRGDPSCQFRIRFSH
jgi:hypothetical protein